MLTGIVALLTFWILVETIDPKMKMPNATSSQLFQPKNQPINLIPMKGNRNGGPTRMECLEFSMHRLTKKNQPRSLRITEA